MRSSRPPPRDTSDEFAVDEAPGERGDGDWGVVGAAGEGAAAAAGSDENAGRGGGRAGALPRALAPRRAARAARNDAPTPPPAPAPAPARETDPRRLEQRQKQIDFGKNTRGYQLYAAAVPR